MITVLLADDHPVFRYGLRAVIASDPELELVAEAEDGVRAVEQAVALAPDVVIIDLNMPGLDGIEATKQITRQAPSCAVLVVTMFEDAATVLSAVRSGARGYLVKGADREEILRAIRSAAAGEAIFGPFAARHLAAGLDLSAQSVGAAQLAFPQLTSREAELLEMITAGYTNSAMAQKLFLSPKTVRNYISTIFAKLGVQSRAEVIDRARSAGIDR